MKQNLGVPFFMEILLLMSWSIWIGLRELTGFSTMQTQWLPTVKRILTRNSSFCFIYRVEGELITSHDHLVRLSLMFSLSTTRRIAQSVEFVLIFFFFPFQTAFFFFFLLLQLCLLFLIYSTVGARPSCSLKKILLCSLSRNLLLLEGIRMKLG